MSSRLALLALVAIASPILAAGCDYYVLGSPEAAPTVNNLTSIDGGDAGADDAVDASASDSHAPVSSAGSPLCGSSSATVAPMACNPDNPTSAKACNLAADAEAGFGTSTESVACRVVAAAGANTSSGQVQPVCAPAGSGGDGSWCKASSECSAAYDCVGSGTCQRYCCAGNVECASSQFCDIQPTTQTTAIQVPVCMPIEPAGGCNLLAMPSSCPAAETCSVVRENGATSCVAVGAAKAGDACDETHCATGLVCLGTPGARRCYQLCHTESPAECSATQQQACTGGLPLFPDPAIGICQ